MRFLNALTLTSILSFGFISIGFVDSASAQKAKAEKGGYPHGCVYRKLDSAIAVMKAAENRV